MYTEIMKILVKMAIKQAKTITDDQEALEVKILFPDFKSKVGKELKVGEYIQYEDNLYKVINQHTCQESWTPDVSQSLFQVVDLVNKGTLDNPIPAKTNMVYEKGKYYIENSTIYKCIRDSEIALQHMPSALVGIYFEIVK